ncbi:MULTISPECIES: substrate-binding domain-containing protein [unclassified Clostridium]|uniref:substrate-binding domain-containing protein n=1 Tax=unclassified Clostridium TaxID=2614128 RepID=UPI000297AEC8|nr:MULTISPECIES: substrate-binding domain-containing protein [unclassified Clostridium]EKQ51028.1 MAG: ABC-type sugar transport system, periplasmic component [Clostridium sp. Maddingley MBC34-26]
MRKRRKQTFIILFLLLILSFLLLLSDTLWHEKDKKNYNISVITRGKNSESLMTMRQGIDQAASEMNVNISFITLSEENSVLEQQQLIDREIKNKADAIIISPTDYEKMVKPIESAMKKVPVILFDSKVDSDAVLPSISCDNYKLGVSLAEEIIKNWHESSNIAVIKNNMECSSIKERYEGFMSVMEKTNNNCIPLEVEMDKQSSYYNGAKKLLEDNNINIVVAFDTSILESVAKVKKDLMNMDKSKGDIEIYGTGSTSNIISFLEDNIINTTAIQNEFNVGYLSVKTAVNKINGRNIDNNAISSTVINRKNMYSEENQRLLFPFIR